MIDLTQQPVLFEDAVSGGFLTEKHIEKEGWLAAGLFDNFQIKAGDTVSLFLANWINFFIFFSAAAKVGAKIHLLETSADWVGTLDSLVFEKPKMLIIEEKFIWNFIASKPQEWFKILCASLPNTKIIVISCKRNSEEREKGAGFFGSYSWKVLKNFITPRESVRKTSFLVIVCGSRNNPLTRPE